MQGYETLLIVVSRALGGKPETADAGAQDVEDLEARLAKAFGNG